MATGREYGQLANAAYESSNHNVAGWSVARWTEGHWYGTGFQGGIYTRENEVVVAFKGTAATSDTALNDLGADFRLAMGFIPNQADSGNRLAQAAVGMARGRPVSIVGHSLGGALAQVVGTWRSLPFVTFNAPGMRGQLNFARGNVFAPGHMVRSWLSSTDEASGINFRIDGDPVSGALPNHVGTKVTFPNPLGMLDAHSMDTCDMAMGRSAYAGRDVLALLT
jgi:hypothetical protein